MRLKPMKPAVSVITPMDNRAGLVNDAIESVLAQTSQDWELVVMDDGSTGGTWEVVERYLASAWHALWQSWRYVPTSWRVYRYLAASMLPGPVVQRIVQSRQARSHGHRCNGS